MLQISLEQVEEDQAKKKGCPVETALGLLT